MKTKQTAKPKKDSPALARKEERLHKDLDHDGEKGEPFKHVEKVLGKKAATKVAAKTSAKAPSRAKAAKKPSKLAAK